MSLASTPLGAAKFHHSQTPHTNPALRQERAVDALRMVGSGRRRLGRGMPCGRSAHIASPRHRQAAGWERRELGQREGFRARPYSRKVIGVVALRDVAPCPFLRPSRPLLCRSHPRSPGPRRAERGQPADRTRADVVPVHRHPLAVAAMFSGISARHEAGGAGEGDDQERGGDPTGQEGGEALEHLAGVFVGRARCTPLAVTSPAPVRKEAAVPSAQPGQGRAVHSLLQPLLR
jgi:hypothetical protein